MESGNKFEKNPGLDPEREFGSGNLEKLGQELSEKLRTEIDPEYGRNFEAPKQFENEDEKNRRSEMSDEENALREESDQINKSITQTTHQLAALPLTQQQQALLERINYLIDERSKATDQLKRQQFDHEIEATTKQLVALPVTSEQGALLDDILGLIDEREAIETSLQKIARDAK